MLNKKWQPLEKNKLKRISELFRQIYPQEIYNNLAEEISEYWQKKLHETWESKSESIKTMDLNYIPGDPLSRIEQKTVLITYADSVYSKNETSLKVLENFIQNYFPAINGIHMLPCCQIAEDRFNDGYFSQITRNKTHEKFGNNETLSNIFNNFFSMADFVLNHIDIQNPNFQSYINGDKNAGECFYVFSEDEFQQRLKKGDFAKIFRPRPFPLFTIYRKKPVNEKYSEMSLKQKIQDIKNRLTYPVAEEIIKILYLFKKIKNDQMMLTNDYEILLEFIDYIKIQGNESPDSIFDLSQTQEVLHQPYIFKQNIQTMQDLLMELNFDSKEAEIVSAEFTQYDEMIFGQYVRALTTFSHVQVDLNTGTLAGLKMLIDDFCWYLSMDLNMMRLDAANFAFKKWQTKCFGLPEVKNLMKILYLSIDCVSPRIVANLEVNDKLSSILKQMSDKQAPPPMMYDFHLASLLPAVFNLQDGRILKRIPELIEKYDLPKNSIRFSLSESHDGKSVRGSMDLLSIKERQTLAGIIVENGGQIKYKSVPARQYTSMEFNEICKEIEVNAHLIRDRIFTKSSIEDVEKGKTAKANSVLFLKPEIRTEMEIAKAFEISPDDSDKMIILNYFIKKMLHGKEPYELCVTTRNSLKKLNISHDQIEVDRYMAFHSLAFALMGRNVKAVYFNDLLGLHNDSEKYKKSGELRDIKRTKSDINFLKKKLHNKSSFCARVARQMNNLIALVDQDPALNFRGHEAEIIDKSVPSTCIVIHNHYQKYQTFTIINLKEKQEILSINLSPYLLDNSTGYFDNFKTQEKKIIISKDGNLNISLPPFARIWLSNNEIKIPEKLLY